MKKRFISSFVEAKFLIARCLTLLILALLSTNLAWGAETELSESLDLTSKTAGIAVYNSSLTYGDWTIVNGANNNKGWTYFKMGGKSTTISSNNPCYIYYSANSGVSSKVDKITVSIAAGSLSANGMSVNSWGVYVYSDKAMTTQIDYVAGGTITKSAATFDFTPSAGKTWGKGYYYKVSWDLANTNASVNGIVCVDKITLYSINDAPDPVLQSIAISGTPKTAYETGESFDVTGLIVTGTYDIGDPQDLTADAEWAINPATFTSTSQTSVSVTATVDGKSDTKNYNVTVNEHVITPGTYEISLNNDLYGISIGNSGTEQSTKVNDITVVSGCANNAQTKTNYQAGHIRYYANSYLKLSVPNGFVITNVTFTKDVDWSDSGISVEEGSYSQMIWTGESQNVQFSFSAQCRASSISVTYEAKKTLESIAIKTAPKATYNAKETFDPTGMVITATYDDASTKDITYDANDDKWSFSLSLETLLKGTDTKVTVTYGGKTAEQAITVTRLSAGLAVASETKDVVVYATPDISEWYSVAEGYDGIVSVVSSNPDVFDVEETTGLAYAAGTATLTITAPQTDYYAEDSKTIVVTVSAEAVHYTVKWINKGAEYTEGNPTTDVIAGQKVETLPTAPTAIEGTAFMGWTAIETITDGEAPTDLFKTVEDAPTVDADVVYRAVYAQEGVGEPIKGFILSNDAPADGDNVLITGLNNDKYYALKVVGTSVSAIELTMNNDIVSNTNVAEYTWTASEVTGNNTGIIFKIGSGDPLHINSSAIKTANGNTNGTFEFAADATNGGFQMKSNQNSRWLKFTTTPSFTYSTEAVGGIYFFKETELPGEVTYVNYSLNNVEPIKDITVTPSVEEAETYWDAFTVTLTCATTGAEIRYTLDGSDPKESETVYSSAIEISGSNETITLRAIATDGNDNWSKEVTKEYTFGPIFSSLEDLAAADLTSGTTVKVSFENVPIKSIFVTQQGYRNGIYFDIQKGGKDIEIYYQNVPNEWVAGGKVSGTMICPWKSYSGTWELAPEKDSWTWSNLTYVAPTTVTIASSGYSSFSSTYAVTIPEGITAYYATGVEGNKVSMIEVEGEVIPANEGVIIKGEALQSYTFIETVSDETFNGNKLVAVSERIENLNPEVTIEDVVYKNYVFTGGQFHPFTSGATVNVGAGKAYLQVEKPSDPNAKLEMSFGDVTGIESLTPALSEGKGVYNLQGVRVSENYKGIIIVNGKKYMNK